MAESLLIADPLDAIEGESLGWTDDEIDLLVLLLASDLSTADRYWRLIAPVDWLDLLTAVRLPVLTPIGVTRPPVWFDVDRQRYGLGNRGMIQQDALRNALRKAVSNAEGRAVRLTRSLVAGVVPIDQWQRQMAVEIKQASATFAVLGAGGVDGVSKAIIDDAQQRMTFQLQRLEKYAKQIETREPVITEPSFERRPAAYMRHTGTTHAEAQRISHGEAGFLEELNNLSESEHCRADPKRPHLIDCPTIAAKGWQKIGTLPQIGGKNRPCLWNCLCHFSFRKRPPVERNN